MGGGVCAGGGLSAGAAMAMPRNASEIQETSKNTKGQVDTYRSKIVVNFEVKKETNKNPEYVNKIIFDPPK